MIERLRELEVHGFRHDNETLAAFRILYFFLFLGFGGATSLTWAAD